MKAAKNARSIESYKQELAELNELIQLRLAETGVKLPESTQQRHGKEGVALEDTVVEEKRQKANLSAQVKRARDKLNRIEILAAYAISHKKDVERYKRCFIYENMAPDVEYIQRMTGCSLYTIKDIAEELGKKWQPANLKQALANVR